MPPCFFLTNNVVTICIAKMHTLQQNFLKNEEQIEKFVKLVIKSLKVLTHEFLVGIGAWLAPAYQGFCVLSAALQSSCLLWLWSSRLTGPLGDFSALQTIHDVK